MAGIQIRYVFGVVAELRLEASRPLTPLTLDGANDLGSADGGEAVHECDAYVDFGGLSVGVPCGNALVEGFEAAHLS